MTVWWLARGLDHLPAGEQWLSAAEAERATRMPYTKRRSEFLIARLAAKHALARVLDLPVEPPERLAAVEVRHKPSGAPEAWATGRAAPAAMSLTDRADWAVCVASLRTASLGCDLEVVEPRTPAFVRDYLTAGEQTAVARAGDAAVAANLIWSAKESALKVLETGLRRDTRSVEVTLPDATGATWAPLSVRPAEGGLFPGWWRRFGPFLLTVVSAAAFDPPEALEQPSGLEAARPTHRWLAAPRR